jgi:hypothetical protein
MIKTGPAEPRHSKERERCDYRQEALYLSFLGVSEII